MDIVDNFNHLTPSDQLDDTLIIGQNLECEASNEFGPGLGLEDSLKNMLSDKDPMFGCASSQFNLLDNDDSTFNISGSAVAGLDGGSTSTGLTGQLVVSESTQVKRPVGRPRMRPRNVEPNHSDGPQAANTSSNTTPRGRPGKKPVNRLQKSFLIEKGVRGLQLKRELTLGGRINVNDLDGRLWLNPSVVLRRLTVTIGGFRIELLPGPSYVQSADASFDSGFSYGGDVGFGVLPHEAVSVQNPTPENVAEVDGAAKSCGDDTTLGLGPYVNPNDVQTANGPEVASICTQETKVDNQSVSRKGKPVNNEKDGIKQSQNDENNRTSVSKEMDVREQQQMVAKNPLKSKQGLTSPKNRNLVSSKPGNVIKGSKGPQNMPSKVIQRGDLHKIKSVKEKKNHEPLKRSGEDTVSEHPPKVQKIHGAGDLKLKPKVPSSPSLAVKKVPTSGNRDQQDPTKPPHSNHSSKVETAHPAHGHPGHSFKTPEDGGQEKPKMKKPEKLLQRQKSKNARTISVDEPQLFVPDNAPVVKRESVDEQPANSDAVWDGNNCCGLCKKHHNNMFMVGCGRCDDWFHGDCVGLDLNKVREMEEEDQMYVCLKCCEEESKKVEPEPSSAAVPEDPVKTEVQDQKLAPKPKPGPSQALTSGGVRPVRKESDNRQSTDVKEAAHKTGVHPKDTKSKNAAKKPASVEDIRRSVRDSLKEILLHRLKESDLNVSVERASEVAKKTERELFHLYKDTENKYKNKYRSLMFNLKDTKNNVLFKRVLKGEISPGNLIRMSPEELASKELAAWRQRENRHTIEMIEKEQREAERRPITKITHKGEIEIESQEPVKAAEPAELEPVTKSTETATELSKTTEKNAESTKTEKDTTSQHKSHLFDLHCKICTGRMAPPVKEEPTKVVKVATTVVRRQSTKAEDVKSTTPTPPAADDDLHLTVLEESFRKAQSGFEESGRTEPTSGRDEEAAFLSNLKSLWRGFIHMHSVAKLVTKAFPVSGILDNLTQDLPDSIQVGGRISPQTVWDYLEKIRATGTKEVCLIRFSPETEEDEISYTLLYAYFSSRKRFGVVSNNLKQVKDMYLIPLGASEKVPHQLVPFDGPGLETNRANLLLGLIIRQRPKRDFLPVDMNETARINPEVKSITVPTKDVRAVEEEEKLYLSSLTSAPKKEKSKQLDTTEDVDEPITESFEEPCASEEPHNQEHQKPLRFLPGVLVGWGGELPPLPDLAAKPVRKADDAPKTQPAQKKEAPTSGNSKSPTAAAPRERFIIKKKEVKPVKAEVEPPSQTDASVANNSSGRDAAAAPQTVAVSLKDKPPDVSTEAFLASLSTIQSGAEPRNSDTLNKGVAGVSPEPEKGMPETSAAPDHANSSKPPLSGILKKSSAYSSGNEDKAVVLQKDKAVHTAPVDPSSRENERVTPFHQGYLQLSQAEKKPKELNQTTVVSGPSEKKEDPSISQVGAEAMPVVDPPSVQTPQPERHPEASQLHHDAVLVPALPEPNSAAPVPLQQPQAPGSYDPPDNHGMQWAQDDAPHASPEPPSKYSESYSEASGQPASLAKDYKRLEERSWEKPRNAEDREHHGRHGHHRDSYHGKKSRHHDREKKHDRSYDEKYRERSRHHGHSEDRYGEKRKERLHSDDYTSRHKDRHRHRRDSDYENGRRGSKDSYSS